MHVTTAAQDSPAALRQRALDALELGNAPVAHESLRRALQGSVELEWLNDLAVLTHRLGDREAALALLHAALTIDPEREDAKENLTALAEAGSVDAAWRRSSTLGGPDPGMYERAFPGMPRPDVMSEHCSRYAYALGLVGAKRVLDLGCGTGYGSEMLSWAATSVEGFDLWQPRDEEHPRWAGVRELHYGHDLCRDPLPRADLAVMFEVIEHLPDAPAALRIAWEAVDCIVGSFPNPVHHGSWMNQYHVNDWSLEQFEQELRAAAAPRFGDLELVHHHQPLGSPLLVPGRDPAASFWVVVAHGVA